MTQERYKSLFGYVEAMLVVPDKTAVSRQPGKRAFDDPAVGPVDLQVRLLDPLDPLDLDA